MNKKAITFGIIAVTIMSIGVLIPFWFFTPEMNKKWGEVAGYTVMILAMATIFFAIRDHRRHQSELLSFKQGLLFGTYVNFIASVLFAIFSYAIYAWIYPDFLQSYMDQSIEQVRNSTMDPNEIERQISEIEANKDFYLSPLMGGMLMFITVFPIGLVVTIVSALLLKNDKVDQPVI